MNRTMAKRLDQVEQQLPAEAAAKADTFPERVMQRGQLWSARMENLPQMLDERVWLVADADDLDRFSEAVYAAHFLLQETQVLLGLAAFQIRAETGEEINLGDPRVDRRFCDLLVSIVDLLLKVHESVEIKDLRRWNRYVRAASPDRKFPHLLIPAALSKDLLSVDLSKAYPGEVELIKRLSDIVLVVEGEVDA